MTSPAFDSVAQAFADAQFEERDPALSADGRSALVPYRLRAAVDQSDSSHPSSG